MEFKHDGWDENTTFEVTCQLRSKYKACSDWVRNTVQNVNLEVNGTWRDWEFEKVYLIKENVVKFVGTLSYESHHRAKFSCVYDSDKTTAVLASQNKTFHRVDELHDYTITPEKSEVLAGGTFALTCKTDSVRALETLSWKMSRNEDFKVMMSRDEKTLAGYNLSYTIQDSVKNLNSVLEVTTEKDGQFGEGMHEYNYTFHCSEENTFHSNQKQGVASVIVSGDRAAQVSVCLVIALLFTQI